MIIKGFIKFLVLTLSLVSVTLAFEGDCIEINNIINKEVPSGKYLIDEDILQTCRVENGRVTQLTFLGGCISLDTFKKILNYKTSIRKLVIYETDLTQSHIDAIGDISSLEELEFSNCKLEKNLKLDALYSIYSLTLIYTDFTDIIKDFRKFKNLKNLEIDLIENIPSGIIETIFDLDFLEVLYLYSINDVNWSKLKNLDALKEFYCSQCHMKSIPDSLFQLGNLQIISLYGNEIPEIPDDIRKLQNLRKLELTDNQITEIPKAVTELTNLQKLLLGSNLIKSIPDELENLKKLYDLSLGNNQLEKFPSVLKNLQNLQYLDLDNNKIYDVLPEYLNDLPKLTMIYLNNNGNIKGKVLTNDSLEVCYYDKDYDLCVPKGKEIKCFGDDYNFKTCDDNASSNPTENDECNDFYSYLENKESGLYKKSVSKCITTSQGKMETL